MCNRDSVISLFTRISDYLKKTKKFVDHVTGDWWNVEIPWTTTIKKSQRSFLPDTVSFASDIKLKYYLPSECLLVATWEKVREFRN